MFAFCTFQANCVFNYCIRCQLGWATNRIIQYMTCDSQRAREDGKSSHHAKMYCLVSVVCGHHICKQVWTPLVGKKLLLDVKKKMTPTIQGAVAVPTCGIVAGHVLKACFKY